MRKKLHEILTEYDMEPLELAVGSIMALLALVMLFGGDAIFRSRSYQFMNDEVSYLPLPLSVSAKWCWIMSFAAIGEMLSPLMENKRWRIVSFVLGMFIWTSLSVTIILSGSPNLSGFVYGIFGALTLWILLRLGTTHRKVRNG